MSSAEVINKWTPYVEVINGYGPTETSVFATLAKITPASEPACIGHGIRSTCTWVVDPDDHDRLTPVGSVGELALSGRALAREYLNNPEKTNAEFIDNPRWAAAFPTTTANRIYKTGDLVRYYPNGAIECLGRKDHQVKLHGQRMELGEIESRLSQMDSIRHAIVLLPKTGLIKKRLVAILAVNAGDKSLKSTNDCQLVDPSVMHAAKLPEVQASLEKQLPIYMVPQAWVVMQSLPMLVSGKIDRKQITAWIEQLDKPNYERIMKDYDDIKRGKVPVPETKSVETGISTSAILRDVCAQVLNLEAAELDMQRSFLSLGTHTIIDLISPRANMSIQAATVSLVWQWSQKPESRVSPSDSKTSSRPNPSSSLQRERHSRTTKRSNRSAALARLLALISHCRLSKICTSSMLPMGTRVPADSTKALLSAYPARSTAQRSGKPFRPSYYAMACSEQDSAKTAMVLGSNALQG
jgi:sulfur relay (sulfurtransferase) DsrF/TusC family protein